ncbi:MAG: agmatine deiminase family protein, partial [Candidatus Cloacimonetes bacterium]|nr:agmatine deiminase family protein [Candidatus Cloacimonadota bacterium]
AELLASLHNLEGQSFRVERIPMPPFTWGGPNGFIPYSYTNSLICNNKVLVPVYGFADLDTQALAIYADLMPDYEIYGIDSNFIIEWWGAVHCVTNLHFAENPLVVLHQPLTDALPNSNFSVRFRVNPGFEDIAASVLYRNVTDTDFNEAICCFQNGIWQTTLPTTTEDLLYYIDAVALSGETEFPARYPENAPEACCLVSVSGTSNSHDIISTDIRMYNYPNPFNPSTVIAFSAYGVKQLRIRIYNLKGQIVKEMQCDTENTGHDGSVVWDGTDRYGRALPGGVYYIQLLKGDLPLLQKKCVLLK